MVLPVLIDDRDLFMCATIGSLVFSLASLFFYNYFIYFLIVALVTFLAIGILFINNLIRDCLGTDCNKMETRITFIDDSHSRDLIEESKRKEIESKFEEKLEFEKEKMKNERNKLKEGYMKEIVGLMEQLRVFEEKIEVINGLNHERCTILEEEKRVLVKDLEKERENVSRLEENYTTLEVEFDKLKFELEGEQKKVLELEHQSGKIVNMYVDLETELDEEEEKVSNLEFELKGEQEKVSNLEFKLKGEQEKVSDLEKKCRKIEEEKVNIGNELEEERGVKKLSRITIQELREVTETLKKNLSLCDNEDDKMKKLEEKNKKISKLEKKCKKLEVEKKLGDAERENLLLLLNSQASIVEVYKDMLNKEECLMKMASFVSKVAIVR